MPMFEVGEKVFAKWPGTKTWYPGKITHKIDSLNVNVEFEDGTTLDELPIRNIKSERSLRSRSRGRSRSRSRSRGRSKSPARTKPKQTPSPTRKPRSAAKQLIKTPTTPTRQSTRIKEIVEKQEAVTEEKKISPPVNDRGDQSRLKEEPKKVTKDVRVSKYEFGGPVGAFVLTLGVPLLLLTINLGCDKKSCSFTKLPAIPRKFSSYFDRETTLIYFGFMVLHFVLAALPLGREARGLTSKSGSKLTYRCNGFLAGVVSYILLAVAIYVGYPVTVLYNKLFKLSVMGTLFAVVLSTLLFVKSRNLAEREKSDTGNTGCPSYDWFVGREQSPRVGPVDLKMFLLIVGLVRWQTINAVLVWKAYNDHTLNPALLAVAVFQNLFVADFLFFQSSLLTTMYFRHHGLGFMNVFASVALVPFLYGLQTRYLLEHSVTWNPASIAGFIILNLIGYIVYRGSSSEKDRFRTDPHNPVFANFNKIPSPSGRKLLASGWWGLCRHPNYLGSIIMAIAWTLPCGCGSAVPYVYPVLHTAFLLYRARVDDQLCRKKHGAAWERYCRDVKYTLIPHVY